MPCQELFNDMPEEYREKVLPKSITARIAVEAGVPMGWERYVGTGGAIIGIDHFGASAPGGTLMEKLKMSVLRLKMLLPKPTATEELEILKKYRLCIGKRKILRRPTIVYQTTEHGIGLLRMTILITWCAI
jgi:hypothetical protein